MLIAWNIEDMTERWEIELSNSDSDVFTSLAYCNLHKLYALGTASGKVFLMNEKNTSDIELAYKGTGKITSLNFSESSKFLAIGLEEATGVVYNMNDKRFFRCREGHEEGLATFTIFNREETHLISLGSDGFANVYLFDSQC